MVVIFPTTRDQSWRWQTSNSDYGKFYVNMSQHGYRGGPCDEIHAECHRKCDALSRQLTDLKAELERLRVGRSPRSPRSEGRSPHHHHDTYTSRPGSPNVGDCNCNEKVRIPCDNAFHTVHDLEYNGGQRTEPQMLQDHLRAEHPRLVKRLQPKLPIPSIAKSADCSRRGTPPDKTMVNIHSSHRASEGDEGRPHHCKMVGMYRRPDTAENDGGQGGGGSGGDWKKGGGYRSKTSSKGDIKKVLPPSQRYNFYRYYGFAGQGAKTSRGWSDK